eukprot:TRINITY_DN54_c0_g1_i2.p1 TRINITY_DN54_c0_g1~~TRINITY_DN54_c0_g1_i2.p1  ORF type:complete len:405 (-),score=38.33 TRINITY_DN54_c0_g1_i2:31-1245(-)
MSTAGPVSGFIVQPIIGVISDTYTSKFGRRRPFIAVGTVFTAVGMALIACSVLIGNLLGDKDDGSTPSEHTFSIAFAIAGLWIMNLFTNVIQGPARALVNDVVPAEKLQLANATVSAVMGFSAIAANLVGAQFLNSENPYFVIFLMGVGFTLFSMVPTLLAGKESVYVRPESAPQSSLVQVFYQIFVAFKTMPRAMLKVVVIYFFSWVAYTPLMINQTLLFQRNVYPSMPQYGLFMGMYSLALFATVSFTFSLALPYIVKLAGAKFTYFGTQILTTGCLVALWALVPLLPWESLFFTSLTAINFTAFNSIPFAITTEIVGTEKCGLYMGVLNSASVIAQTVAGLITTPVLQWQNGDIRWAMGLGAIFSVIAVVAALFLETAPKDAVLDTINDEEDQIEREPLVQ